MNRKLHIDLDDVRLAVVRDGPAVDETDKPLVLFLHGFPELAHSWRHQIAALAAAGYPVMAPDQRGYGDSDKPAGVDDYAMSRLVGDVTGLLDHAGVEKAVVVGHDWGALVLWALPFYAPERLLGCAGLNVPLMPVFDRDPIPVFRRTFGDDMYIVRFQEEGAAEPLLERDVDATFRFFMRRPSAERDEPQPGAGAAASLDLLGQLEKGSDHWGGEPLLDDAERAIYVRAFERGGFTAPLHWYRNMSANQRDLMRFTDEDGKLPFVNLPALQIMTELDRACPPQLADGMETRIGPLEYHLLQQCGHWTQQEQPEAVNRLLLDWLGRHFA
ncbi:alpha/beta fold hydrolase [Yunchengibacter salinarum]|uniref:alpha/beta fold hydrolase n=1 Tax=Yunchengibacter salinarum TaxID=3133399 RepID=UPI0035B63D63